MMVQMKESKSGIALVATLLVILLLGMLLSAGMIGVDSQMKTQVQRYDNHEAFYTAESGLSRAITEVRRNPNWGLGVESVWVDEPLQRTEAGDLFGTYTVSIVNGGISGPNGWETRWIRSEGRNSLGEAPRVIHARVAIESPTRFMVMTLGDLRVQQGAEIAADILGTNVIFDPGQGQISIRSQGDQPTTIFYRQEVSGQDEDSVVISGDVEFTKLESFTFPGVDKVRYQELAENLVASGQSVYEQGDLVVDLNNLDSLAPSGDTEFFQPEVIYAEGDIRIEGRYDRSLLIVSGGNIFLTGDIVAAQLSDELQIAPQIGLLASGDVLIPNGALSDGQDMTVEAFIMADGQGDADGIFMAQGEASSLGTFSFQGSMAVRGEGDLQSTIDMSAFDQRTYSFNPDFNVNRTIPYLPFLVNLIEWREALAADLFPPES